jgi:hypothetical protein
MQIGAFYRNFSSHCVFWIQRYLAKTSCRPALHVDDPIPARHNCDRLGKQAAPVEDEAKQIGFLVFQRNWLQFH